MSLSDYWARTALIPNDGKLIEEARHLPALSTLSSSNLRRVIYAFSTYPKPRKDEDPWVAAEYWSRFEKEWLEAAFAKRDEFMPYDYAILFRSMRLLGMKEEPAFLSELAESARIKLPSFQVKELAFLITELSFYSPDLLPRPFTKEFFDIAQPKLPLSERQDFLKFFWAPARMGIMPPPVFLDDYFRLAETRLKDFEPGELMNILWSCAKLRLVPPAPFLARLYEKMENEMPAMNKVHLANIATSAAILALELPKNFLHSFYAAASKKLEHFTLSQAARLFWASSVFSVREPLPDNARPFLEAAKNLGRAKLEEADRNYFTAACWRFAPALAKDLDLPFETSGFPRSFDIFMNRARWAGFLTSEKDITSPSGGPFFVQFGSPEHILKDVARQTVSVNGWLHLIAANLQARHPGATVLCVPHRLCKKMTADDLRYIRHALEKVRGANYLLFYSKEEKNYILDEMPAEKASLPGEVPQRPAPQTAATSPARDPA